MFKNNSGFSLMEIMVASGLLGVITIAVMQMNRTMSRGQATAEAKMEAIEIKRHIVTTLADKKACENTLVSSSLGDSIPSIKNSSNVEIFKVGSKYGANTLELQSIRVVDDGDLGSGMRQGKLVVIFNNLKKSSLGQPRKSFASLLKVKAASATGVIDECFDNSSGLISTANETTCLAIGGVWDSAASTCTISHFVKKDGDTMTGKLNLPTLEATGKIIAPEFCNGADCRAINELALSNQTCPNGQVSFGVNQDGTLKCKALNCSKTQFFAGLDSSGNPVCRPYPTNTCPTNQYVTEVKANGTVLCARLPSTTTLTCPTGQVIQSIQNAKPVCVTSGGDIIGKSCPVGSFLRGFASNGSLICATDDPVNCIGSWGSCQKTDPNCGSPSSLPGSSTCRRFIKTVSCSGVQEYTISQPGNSLGKSCSAHTGATRICNLSFTLQPDTNGCK